MDTHQRIVIVGGGIFGVATADALVAQGFHHVEVLERGRLGEAATARAAGIVSLQTWNDADARLILQTREGLERLREWARGSEHPAAESFWRPTGGITIADGRHVRTLDEMLARLRGLGLEGERLDAEAASLRFPHFRFAPGETILHGPADGYVESTDCLDVLRRRAQGRGARFREGVPAHRVKVDKGQAVGVTFADGTSQRADQVVVAGGAWTGPFLERSGHPVAAIPYRTQLAALDLEGVEDMPVLHDTVHHFYARRESAGRFLAGDGTQLRRFDPDDFDPSADAAFAHSVAERVVARFSHGDKAMWRSGWAGLCVGTPDRRPLAGPWGAKGLHVLTGDNGFGVMRSLALAAIVAEGVMGRPVPIDVDPGRFGPNPPPTFELSEGFSLPD